MFHVSVGSFPPRRQICAMRFCGIADPGTAGPCGVRMPLKEVGRYGIFFPDRGIVLHNCPVKKRSAHQRGGVLGGCEYDCHVERSRDARTARVAEPGERCADDRRHEFGRSSRCAGHHGSRGGIRTHERNTIGDRHREPVFRHVHVTRSCGRSHDHLRVHEVLTHPS